ncbi:MAG: hypothetical protein ABSB75_09425, partial [Candidatus Limnocylindrales bacterium]
ATRTEDRKQSHTGFPESTRILRNEHRSYPEMSFNLPLRFKSIVLALVLFVLASSTFLRADTVVLKNGDKFSGTAVKLEGGKLTFQTAFADAIVARLETGYIAA